MIKVDSQFRPPELDFKVLNRESKSAADDITQFLRRQFKLALIRNRKVVTGETLQSFEKEFVLDSPSRGIFLRRLIASKVFKFIEEGRKPGGKLPPEKPMIKWFRELNIPKKSWFPIRLSIARKGIKPRKIRQQAIKASLNYIHKRAGKAGVEISKTIVKTK